MDVTATPQSQATVSAVAQSNSTTNALTSDFETFLKMLTAQAKYQDPLEPIDSTEYAAQLAQFSSVEQQVQTNDLLTAMATQLGQSSMAQFAGWIGMEARSSAPAYFDGQPITLHPNPAAVADQVTLVVYDESGSEVQRVDLPKSAEPIEWGGVSDTGAPFEAGQYSFQIESRANGQIVLSEPAEHYARIIEARNQAGDTVLILEGGATVSVGQINAVREPQ